MITDIPTAADFHMAGLNQLYLAWQIAMRVTHDQQEVEEQAFHLDDEEATAAAAEYWAKSQPVLANAFSLVQQGMEMALKGRIAAISPYLLIARDPKDWPSGVEARQIPFSEFRTLDAADLVRVHNTFSPMPLDDNFRAFWDGVRRDRNKLMHSVPTKTFEPVDLIRSILSAAITLYSEMAWPQWLFQLEAEGAIAAYGLSSDFDYNTVMGQVDVAVQALAPAETKRFFSFDKRQRAYVCPSCWGHANRDWQEDWPTLAQLRSKSPDEGKLHCVVCDQTTMVTRLECVNYRCKGNVIHDAMCLTCLADQESPSNFPSGLENDDLPSSQEYMFHFERKHNSSGFSGRFADDASAIEHARQALSAPYLQQWCAATVSRYFPRDAIGTWLRTSGGLVWRDGFRPGLDFDFDAIDAALGLE